MSILMTVEELAKYLKIKPDTIYKKVRKGELPAIKLGKLIRFPRELIDEWIIDQAAKTMKEVRAAKQRVEARVGEAVEKVEHAVERAVGQAKETAESAVEEVRKTQEHLTKSIRGLWKDFNGISKSAKKKKAAKSTKIVKTREKKAAKKAMKMKSAGKSASAVMPN
ncbi:MAG: helix-turn-helix domain-containing protein [Deltaproteobacteria bacterium]|nr:helix-turn-helix domain-containing protein [Deltaproteobacteria bacterium]